MSKQPTHDPSKAIYGAIPFDRLRGADLILDATYEGGGQKNVAADPLGRLLPVGNQGGFRYAGGPRLGSCGLMVLYTSGLDPDWPDVIDYATGRFTYYGDNKAPGRRLHDTQRGGNDFLRQVFEALHASSAARHLIPPFFVFSKGLKGRDVVFRGLAAPGAPDLTPMDDLVAVWKTKGTHRFQNYRAAFTILDCDCVARKWVQSLGPGQSLGPDSPPVWRTWVESGVYRSLQSQRTIGFRPKQEQLPASPADTQLVRETYEHFRADPFKFEECAARLWQMAAPQRTTYDVTQPRKDGGRDAVGTVALGPLADSIRIDYALEAKCFALENPVGVKEVSRLISRLRYRQFGVLVTTSFLGEQAYEEIREDGHPVVVIASRDIAEILKTHQLGDIEATRSWLTREFPV